MPMSMAFAKWCGIGWVPVGARVGWGSAGRGRTALRMTPGIIWVDR